MTDNKTRKNLIDCKPGDKITEFFLLKSNILKTSNKGGEYLDLVISDKTGDMTAMIWDLENNPENRSIKDLEKRAIVKIRGTVTEWKGQRQMKVLRIRPANPEDNVDLSELVKTDPIEGEEMYRRIYDRASSIQDEELRKLTLTIMEDNREKLLYFPAASRNHHAIKGGLLYHVYRMLLNGESMCRIYSILNRDLVVCGVILHDIAKLEEIDSDELGMADSYTFEGQMLGHIVQGIKLIDRYCIGLNIKDEKRVMVEHMILSHHYEPEFGSPKKPMFPEAEILHYLDNIDAKMYDIEHSLEGIEPGDFSDRIWSMDNRKMYRATFENKGLPADFDE